MDSDVAGLQKIPSYEPVTLCSRKAPSGVSSETGEAGDETGETRGKYPVGIGDAGNTGNTSIVSKSKWAKVEPMTSATSASHEREVAAHVPQLELHPKEPPVCYIALAT